MSTKKAFENERIRVFKECIEACRAVASEELFGSEHSHPATEQMKANVAFRCAARIRKLMLAEKPFEESELWRSKGMLVGGGTQYKVRIRVRRPK